MVGVCWLCGIWRLIEKFGRMGRLLLVGRILRLVICVCVG